MHFTNFLPQKQRMQVAETTISVLTLVFMHKMVQQDELEGTIIMLKFNKPFVILITICATKNTSAEIYASKQLKEEVTKSRTN